MDISPARFRETALLLAEVLRFEHPADAVISHFFRERPKLGAADRAWLAETVYSIIRRKASLEHGLNPVTPRLLLARWMTQVQGLSVRALSDLLKSDEQEALKQAKQQSGSLTPAARLDWPQWLYDKLQPLYQDEGLVRLGQALQQSAPLDLRINPLLTTRDEVLQAFAQQGIAAEATPYSPLGVRLKDKIALQKNPLFLSGKVEVQDEGSQLLGLLLEPKRQDMVVDFCAGAGGKTLLLGALMNSQGRIYAFDVSEKRLNNLKPRLKRSGLSNITPQRIASEADSKIKRLAGKIDRVLVDAPCSGLGTLRRNPDLKWRQNPQSVEELTQKQTAILNAAARLPKPGGRLVYATCSLLQDENEQIVQQFLQQHPDYQLVPADATLQHLHIDLHTGNYLRLNPSEHNTDGFFAAILERKTAQP